MLTFLIILAGALVGSLVGRVLEGIFETRDLEQHMNKLMPQPKKSRATKASKEA